MAHALAAHFRHGDFDAALLADNTAELHAFVLTAQAFEVFDWAKDFGAEQAITLWLERTVVNGFWLFNFTKRP